MHVHIQHYRSRSGMFEGNLFFLMIWFSVIGIVATEDGKAVVEEEENEQEEECDADGGAADPVDGVGLAGGEKGGDKGAAVGGEELNGEKEKDGKKEEAQWAQKLRDCFGYGLALIPNQKGH